MTDARLLANPKLLLAWSDSLDVEPQSFDAWLYSTDQGTKFLIEHQTGGSEHVDSFRSCADDAGHSVRVTEGTLTTAGGR